MLAACQNQLAELLHYRTLLRLYEMTNTNLTSYREKLLALRASLLGDMNQMEDDSLKDHAKTTSIPTDREELGSDDADQELTMTLLGSDEGHPRPDWSSTPTDRRRQVWPVRAVRRTNPQVPPGRHPLCRRLRAMCLTTGRRPRALIQREGYRVDARQENNKAATIVAAALKAGAGLSAAPVCLISGRRPASMLRN